MFMSEQKEFTEEQLAAWRQQSKDLIETIFLRHPETEAEMVVVSDLLDNGDGSFSFIVTDDPSSDMGFQFLVGMAEVSKGEVTPVNLGEDKQEHTPTVIEMPAGERPRGGLADLVGYDDGSSNIILPYGSEDGGGIVGLDGAPLS